MNRIIIALIFFCIPSLILAQGNYKINYQDENYIETDSSKKVGVYFKENTEADNAQFVIVKIKSDTFKYTPEDLKGYGFRTGEVYESHVVNIDGSYQNVFLERLVEGKFDLYFYTDGKKDIYFIKYNDEWIKMTNEDDSGNFRETLYEIKDCEKIDKSIELVSYNKKSLSKLLNLFNKCKEISFPYAKFGFTVGVVQSSLDHNGFNNFTNRIGGFNNSYTVRAGIFADLPIEVTPFSVYTGAHLQYDAFHFEQEGANNLDLNINLLSLEVPLYMKYTLPTFKFKPYIFGGISMTYNIMNNYEIEDRLLPDYEYNENLISDFTNGFGGGIGVQWQKKYNKAILFELRYHNRNSTPNKLNGHNISIMMGYEL